MSYARHVGGNVSTPTFLSARLFLSLQIPARVFVVLMALAAACVLTAPLYAQPPVQVRTLQKTTRSWDGRLLPPYPRGQPEITILHITLAPGTSLPMHKHPVINAAVLLRGKLTVHLEGGECKRLRAGEGLMEVVERWHFGRATGRVPAELEVFYAGTPGLPITVLKPAASPPRPSGKSAPHRKRRTLGSPLSP